MRKRERKEGKKEEGRKGKEGPSVCSFFKKFFSSFSVCIFMCAYVSTPLTQWSTSLHLLGTGIKGICCHACLVQDLGNKPRASCMLGKHSANSQIPSHEVGICFIIYNKMTAQDLFFFHHVDSGVEPRSWVSSPCTSRSFLSPCVPHLYLKACRRFGASLLFSQGANGDWGWIPRLLLGE